MKTRLWHRLYDLVWQGAVRSSGHRRSVIGYVGAAVVLGFLCTMVVACLVVVISPLAALCLKVFGW